ncbi:MAG: hypothetical protein Q8S26_02235 [Azonexus sp.]|nr:hypothetical protein [Azonexus sp.]
MAKIPIQQSVKSGIKFLFLAGLAALWGWTFSPSKPLIGFANYCIAIVALVVGVIEIAKGLKSTNGAEVTSSGPFRPDR